VASEYSTAIGGSNEAFLKTQWTVIDAARTMDPARRMGIVARLAGQYWKPVYAYLRHKGMGSEDAKDLTQDFFAGVVMEGELIEKADRSKGRFRNFLLTALNHFATSDYRKKNAQFRRPKGGLFPLEAMRNGALALPAEDASPDEAFTYEWAAQLIGEVLREVEAWCRQAGQQKHWEVFRRTVVEPAFLGTRAPALAELCQELKVADARTASNMTMTVKRRFRSILREKVRQLVRSEEDVEDEIRDLMQILSRFGAAGQSARRTE